MIVGGGGKPAGGRSSGGKGGKGPRVPEVQGDTLTCSYCQAINEHYTSGCPQQSACKRGHEDELMRQYRATGKVCETCHRPGHEMKHHLLAIQDYADVKVAHERKGKGGPGKDNRGNHPNQGGWEPPKGKAREPGKGGPKGAPGKVSDPVARAAAVKQIQCPKGANCWFVANTGECRHWHPLPEYKELRIKFKANQLTLETPKGPKGKGDLKGEPKGKGKGKKGKDNVHWVGEPAPKVAPKAKAAKLAAGADTQYSIQELIGTLDDAPAIITPEAITYQGSKAERVCHTVELADMLGANDKQEEDGTRDVCYRLSDAGPLRKKKKKGKASPPRELKEGGIAEVLEKINLINPGFIQVKEVKDLGEENFVHRKYQRPVGYAATTRVHT